MLTQGEDKHWEKDYAEGMLNCSEIFYSSPASLIPATIRRVSRPAKPVWLTHYFSLLLIVMLTGGCATVESSPHATVAARHGEQPKQAAAAFGETPALDLNAYTTVEKIIPALAKKRVVFVGETHNRYDHHLIQLEIIRRLHQIHPQLAIGMETFQQPFQQHLDDYVSGAISEQEMLRATEYFKRWRMDFRLYAPILRYAREHQLPVIALNLPVELTSKVARVGLEGMTEEERTRLPAEIDRSDAAYEARIKKVFEYHPKDGGQKFEYFLEVQLLWDEGMAERAAAFLQEYPDHHMVIVAGSGHLAYGSAIPRRLTRRVQADTAIVLNSWQGAIVPGLADYLLLPVKQPLPPTGKIGALLKEEDGSVKVTTCFEDSPCTTAGIKAGDRILSIDDKAIKNLADFRLALWGKQPGDTISIDIFHKRWFSAGKTMTSNMTLK
ncbi:MAG: ChaN family lipoprotein [Gammaproteobacteria bacterium]|nr:ChaN family lipoprotein [Gammaproteobacteria bacterium]